jgi:hypothetical protein
MTSESFSKALEELFQAEYKRQLAETKGRGRTKKQDAKKKFKHKPTPKHD